MSKEFNTRIAIVALILTLGIALGGFYLYNRFLVEKPVQDEMKQVQGVKQVEIQRKDKKVLLSVEMAEMADFSGSYQAVDKIACERFGTDGYTLEIKDKRNQKLEQVYDDLQLYLYQGIANNSFLWLDREVGRVARDNHLGYKLKVDEDNLYLQLHQHGSYLYEVIKRGDKQSTEIQTGR